jgi:nucleotide-binding universal stress UspA family protein
MIVVGFDGSAPAVTALHWAADEAVLRGVDLHVLRAWGFAQELAAILAERGMADGVPPADEVAATVQARLEHDVAALLPAERLATVRCRAAEADPAALLLEAGADADLLVIGPRGRGRVASLVLGSVTLACVQQATSPVVVVRSPRTDTRACAQPLPGGRRRRRHRRVTGCLPAG